MNSKGDPIHGEITEAVFRVRFPKYVRPSKCAADISHAIHAFPNLKRYARECIVDGHLSHMLNLEGLLPIRYREQMYDIPIRIILQHSHPEVEPIVCVVPTDDMTIRDSRRDNKPCVVQSDGRVILSQITNWRPPHNNLTALLHALCLKFSEYPPLWTKRNPGAAQGSPENIPPDYRTVSADSPLGNTSGLRDALPAYNHAQSAYQPMSPGQPGITRAQITPPGTPFTVPASAIPRVHYPLDPNSMSATPVQQGGPGSRVAGTRHVLARQTPVHPPGLHQPGTPHRQASTSPSLPDTHPGSPYQPLLPHDQARLSPYQADQPPFGSYVPYDPIYYPHSTTLAQSYGDGSPLLQSYFHERDGSPGLSVRSPPHQDPGQFDGHFSPLHPVSSSGGGYPSTNNGEGIDRYASHDEPGQRSAPVTLGTSSSATPTSSHQSDVPHLPSEVATSSMSSRGAPSSSMSIVTGFPHRVPLGHVPSDVDSEPSGLGALNQRHPEEYETLKLLGAGGFAKVYLLKHKTTGKEVAAKRVDLGGNTPDVNERVKALRKELKILKELDNHFIMRYHDEIEHDNCLDMIIAYMPGGSIYHRVSGGTPLGEDTCRVFTWQILRGVEYLHSKGVIHRDIKGRNIMLDDNDMIKITDFGISKTMEDLVTTAGTHSTASGGILASVYWTSPELLKDENPDKRTDIWSVGCTVVEMLYCKPPLQKDGLGQVQALNRINQHQVTPPEDCSEGTKDFLLLCFKKKEERPTSSQLLANSSFPRHSIDVVPA